MILVRCNTDEWQTSALRFQKSHGKMTVSQPIQNCLIAVAVKAWKGLRFIIFAQWDGYAPTQKTGYA